MPQHYSTVVGERTTADIRATNIAERNKSDTAKMRDITNTNREQGKTLLTRRNQRRVLVGIKNPSGKFIKHTFDSETGLAKKGAG